MRPGLRFLTILALGLLAGCIEKDDSMTFYLQPDGKVDLLLVSDQIRSSKTGLEGTKEEAEWLSDFTRGADDTEKRLRRADAKRVKAVLLKDERPFAAAISGSFASMDDLARFLELNEKGNPNTLAFYRKGSRRELRFHIEGSTQTAQGESKNLYPVFKFVPVQGRIEEAEGFKVAPDSASCTLDIVSRRDFRLAWRQTH
jgi:hypothetical protein